MINCKHAAVGESGKSMTLPRCHPFKVPEVPPVRQSSVDGESKVCCLSMNAYICINMSLLCPTHDALVSLGFGEVMKLMMLASGPQGRPFRLICL